MTNDLTEYNGFQQTFEQTFQDDEYSGDSQDVLTLLQQAGVLPEHMSSALAALSGQELDAEAMNLLSQHALELAAATLDPRTAVEARAQLASTDLSHLGLSAEVLEQAAQMAAQFTHEQSMDIEEELFNQHSALLSQQQEQRQASNIRPMIKKRLNVSVSDVAIQIALDKKDRGPVDGKYPCDFCGREFGRLYNLRAHLKSHSGAKPFPCEQCDQSFARNHDLQRHVKRHSNEKPFICDVCGVGFSRKDALRRHQRLKFRTDNGNHSRSHKAPEEAEAEPEVEPDSQNDFENMSENEMELHHQLQQLSEQLSSQPNLSANDILASLGLDPSQINLDGEMMDMSHEDALKAVQALAAAVSGQSIES